MPVFLLLATFCDLILTIALLGMSIVLMQYLSQAYARGLDEFDLFAAGLTNPKSPNVRTLYFEL